MPARDRRAASEDVVQGALSPRPAGQGARVLPEAAQVLRAQRAQTPTA